jgi:hypothetical protein
MGECNYSSMHSENRLHIEESCKRENNPRYLKYTDRVDPRAGLNWGWIRNLSSRRNRTQISGCQSHGSVTLLTEQLRIHSLTWPLLAIVKWLPYHYTHTYIHRHIHTHTHTHTWNLIFSSALWELKNQRERNRYYKIRGYYSNGVRAPVVPGHPATKFCKVAPNNCGCSVWSMLRVTLLAPRILRWLPDF